MPAPTCVGVKASRGYSGRSQATRTGQPEEHDAGPLEPHEPLLRRSGLKEALEDIPGQVRARDDQIDVPGEMMMATPAQRKGPGEDGRSNRASAR